MHSMKDILLVDLDNTILDFDKAEEYALSKVFSKYEIINSKENQDKYYSINIEYWKKYELHLIEREQLLSQRFEDFFSLFGIKIDGKEVNDYYFSYLSQGCYYVKNSLEFLMKAKEMNMTILIASNGVGSVQKPRIEKSGLKKYFDKIYLSEEIGYNKPDIEFFNSILSDYPYKNRMVMIGDSLSSDIQGGKNFGITTIWYNPNHKESNLPDYQVDNLLDIFKVLEEI